MTEKSFYYNKKSCPWQDKG